MRVRFWGTRGSVPTPGPSTVRYGGNTACVEMRTNAGTFLIFDSGTGIRELGLELGRNDRRQIGLCNPGLSYARVEFLHANVCMARALRSYLRLKIRKNF